MKFLQIGLGSMGKRRIRCLQANAQSDIVAFDPREDRRAEAQEKYGVSAFATLDEGLAANPDAVVISVPGALHMEYLLAGARAGKHLFCEVPLTTKLDGIAELRELVAGKQLVCAPGCQTLWDAGTRILRERMQTPQFGRLLHVTYATGSYLPGWHPYEGISEFYASNFSMGGGNLDVVAQELVWLNWLIGSSMTSVSCRTAKVGDLELAAGTPDTMEIVIEHANGMLLNAHFDLNDRSSETGLRLAGTNGTAAWSKGAFGTLSFYDDDSAAWSPAEIPAPTIDEQVYVHEIGAWLRCLEGKESWPVSLDLAESIVRVLIGLQVSANEDRPVQLEDLG